MQPISDSFKNTAAASAPTPLHNVLEKEVTLASVISHQRPNVLFAVNKCHQTAEFRKCHRPHSTVVLEGQNTHLYPRSCHGFNKESGNYSSVGAKTDQNTPSTSHWQAKKQMSMLFVTTFTIYTTSTCCATDKAPLSWQDL